MSDEAAEEQQLFEEPAAVEEAPAAAVEEEAPAAVEEEAPPAAEEPPAPVEEAASSDAPTSSGLNPTELVNQVKELALKGDVNGLKDLLQSKRGDIEALVKSKRAEVQGIVESKINEYKAKGEEKKAELLGKVETYKQLVEEKRAEGLAKAQEFQLKAKDQYDNYLQQLLALIDQVKTLVFEKIAEIKQKLGLA